LDVLLHDKNYSSSLLDHVGNGQNAEFIALIIAGAVLP